jgi:hypothetical protein
MWVPLLEAPVREAAPLERMIGQAGLRVVTEVSAVAADSLMTLPTLDTLFFLQSKPRYIAGEDRMMGKRTQARSVAYFLAVLSVGALFSGCAHTHNFSTIPDLTEVRATLQGLEGKDVGVALRNGVQAYGEVKALEPDTLKLSTGDPPMEMGLPCLDIQKITVFNHGNAAATGAGIALGAITAFKVAEYVATHEVPIGWLYEIPGPLVIPLTLGLGAAVGGTIASQVFPVSVTYIFLSSQPDTVLLHVDRILEDGDKTIRVRIRDQGYALPKAECEVVRQSDIVYLKASRAAFRKARIPIQ